MKLLALLALLLTIAGWALTVLTGMHLLSGPFEDRTCQTECVRTLFFSGLGAAVGGLLLAFTALLRPGARMLTYGVLVLVLPLAGIYATLFITGNFA